MLLSSARLRSPLFLAAAVSLLLCFVVWQNLGFALQAVLDAISTETTSSNALHRPDSSPLPCRDIDGADDVLVVMKTGATELRKKLPVHFNTTFRCTPHFAIFSDLEEELNGYQVEDVLSDVDDTIKWTHPDFKFYRELQRYKAQGRDVEELIAGNYERAWNLDKWKFLPMMEKALHARPEAKWFVFVEADTHLVWSNLLQWLRLMDPSKPHYIGGQNWVGGQQFAHGGTGFIISIEALQLVVEKREGDVGYFDEMTMTEWAGDLILAKALKTVSIGLTGAWPILQGETPYTLDYTENHLCYPVVTYHHVPAEWVVKLWEFEQGWMEQTPRAQILHRDVFAHFIQPQIQGEKAEWDNMSGDFQLMLNEGTLEDCRQLCKSQADCVQYAHMPGLCHTSKVVRLGTAKESDNGISSTSGWMTDRVDNLLQSVEPCKQDWIVGYGIIRDD
ncbi:glycosyltransferase family 31 protein [Saccharata proteae CBS 121410]|uniref:Glycosyltransferase family 31 protein n=1 Tax=Saccharata proteae CBS 121410 TaxID=1314787 RepID=A0A9P4HYX2_9PEZI|nr:glycosyltransferase family 31 protein [Saccharata proteae CBS 121410]